MCTVYSVMAYVLCAGVCVRVHSVCMCDVYAQVQVYVHVYVFA